MASLNLVISSVRKQAADLPVKAKAVEYVKICSLYGAGFYYIPGTDTCIKIGGAIRFDTTFNGAAVRRAVLAGWRRRQQSLDQGYFLTRERINMTTDTRTATEYGVVRTYANMQFDFSQNRESIAGGFTEVDYAFIQFAGFTFGKAVSQFDPQWALTKPYISSGFLAGSNNTTGIPQIAYTASFGNGVSGTISLENASPYRNAGLWNTATFIVGRARGRSPVRSTAQPRTRSSATPTAATTFLTSSATPPRSGLGHAALRCCDAHCNPGFYGANEASVTPDKYGFAVSGAVEFKNLPTGAGDSLKIEASYAKGAAKYAFTGGTTDTSGGGRFAKVRWQHGRLRLRARWRLRHQRLRSAERCLGSQCLLRALLEPGMAHVAVRQLQPYLLWRCRQRDARRGIQPGRRSPGNEQFVQPGLYGWQHYWHDQLRLRNCPGRYTYCMDPRQEPDPVG
jgi:hypothetical protein